MAQDITLNLGDRVSYDFCPKSEVVGIDRYTMKAFDGRQRSWDSYTLTSEADGPFSRWWIVNVPDCGAHYYVAAEKVPSDAVFEPALGGLVSLNSEGNADLSSEKGALATYRGPDGTLYAEEVFDGADRLIFEGHSFTP